jgi:Raf kinase inhibitor-like YbhB/YbcL family protein
MNESNRGVASVQKTIVVSSDAFGDGQTIPTSFTCDGSDVSPPLRWSGVPDEAVELALLVEDPDAPGGTFVHWLLWGLAPGVSELPEGSVPDGARQGTNGFGKLGWGGPCPPRGHGPHRYVFTLHALAEPLHVDEGATADQLRAAIEGKVIAQGQLIGLYGR